MLVATQKLRRHLHSEATTPNRNGQKIMMQCNLPKGKKISKKQEAAIRREMAKMIFAISKSQSTPTKSKGKK